MKLYPPFRNTRITINDHNDFHNYIIENTEELGGNTNNRADWIGRISEHGFTLRKKFINSNLGRPQIKGKYLKLNNDQIELVIGIESNKRILILIIPVFCFCLFHLVINKNLYSTNIFLSVSIFSYLLFGLFHLIDLKKTRAELEKIIKKAST